MTNLETLYHHTLETAPKAHPARRAKIYRGLADIIGNEDFARELVERAEASEDLDRQDGQLALEFLLGLQSPEPRPKKKKPKTKKQKKKAPRKSAKRRRRR